MAVDTTALYCCLDHFCKVFEDWEAHRLISSEHTRQRTGKLSRAEMLFIKVLFHPSPFKHFKAFYLYGIGHQHRACFGDLPHFDRFVSFMPRLFVPLSVLLHSSVASRLASTSRIQANSPFVTIAGSTATSVRRLGARGKTSGKAGQRFRRRSRWNGQTRVVFRLKLHFVINHKGQIMALKITRHLAGKLYADKIYIGRELFNKLWQRGRHLITGIQRNMRNFLIPLADKLVLRKRFVIETVLDILKCEMGLEHSRHRSVINAMVHILSCLVAYAFRPGKPSISLRGNQIEVYP